MKIIDLNSDMGEGFGAYTMGDDAAMLEVVSSANIACGFHAGDPVIMFNTMWEAKKRDVNIGAHPGFMDLYGFGRRVIKGDSYSDIEKHIAYQIGAAKAMAAMTHTQVTYVKPHGALSNMAQDDLELSLAIGRAIKGVDRDLIYMVMPTLMMEKAAQQLGLAYVYEVFADRTYEDDANLTSRKIKGSVIHDSEFAAKRLLAMLEEGAITTTSGKKIKVKIDTVCVHSDTPSAVEMAKGIKALLGENGWTIESFA